MLLAQYFEWVFYGYFFVGVFFAAVFVLRGVGQLDEDARGISPATRLLFFPASAALWPLLWRRWTAASRREKRGSP